MYITKHLKLNYCQTQNLEEGAYTHIHTYRLSVGYLISVNYLHCKSSKNKYDPIYIQKEGYDPIYIQKAYQES